MGALHAGHRANFARARRENDFLVGSIFVNPLQFGPGEDFAAYPRDLDADLEACAAEGVDLVFTPDERELWPRNAYLTPAERRAAPVLYRALEAGRAAWRAGERDPAKVERLAAELVETEPAV